MIVSPPYEHLYQDLAGLILMLTPIPRPAPAPTAVLAL